MKIGEYITVQAIIDQSVYRWVVLSDLELTERHGVKGGIICCIAQTKAEAGKVAVALERDGADTYLVSGAWESLVVGGSLVA